MWEASNRRHGGNSKSMCASSKCCKTNAEMSNLLLRFRVFALHHPLRNYLSEEKSCSRGQRSLINVPTVKKHLNCDFHRAWMKALFLRAETFRAQLWTNLAESERISRTARDARRSARPPDTKKVLGLVPGRFLWSQHVFSEPGGAPPSRPEPETKTPHSPQVCRPPLTDSWNNKVGIIITFHPTVQQKTAGSSSEAGGTGLHRWTGISAISDLIKQTDLLNSDSHQSHYNETNRSAGGTRVFLLARVFGTFSLLMFWGAGWIWIANEFGNEICKLVFHRTCSAAELAPQTPRQQDCWSQELLFFTSTSLSLMLISIFFFPSTNGGWRGGGGVSGCLQLIMDDWQLTEGDN